MLIFLLANISEASMPAGGRPLHGSGQAAKVVLDQALEVLNLSKPALILVLLPQSAKGIRQETKHWGDVVKGERL